MKPVLIKGEYTDNGTVAMIYTDSASDLGEDEYEGVDKSHLAKGSVAYDKTQVKYVYDGENWYKSDGTVVPAESEDIVMFFDFELTETAASDPNWSVVNTTVTADDVIDAIKNGKFAVARCSIEGGSGMGSFAVIAEYTESSETVRFECGGEDGFTLRHLTVLGWVYAYNN